MRDARVFSIMALGLVASATFMPAPALSDRFPSIVTGPVSAVPAGPTRVLVLGTFHLRHIKDRFDPAYLDSVIERLAAFRPAAIAVESMAGDLIASMEERRNPPSLVREVLDRFAEAQRTLGHAAQTRLKTEPSIAVAEAERRLGDSTAPDRLALVMWLLAAYNYPTAVLQWSLVPSSEKVSQSVMPRETVAALDEALRQVNEIPALAVRLVARLGLPRLYAVDDFEDLDAIGRIMPALEKETAQNPLLKAVTESPVYLKDNKRLEEAITGRDLLQAYRTLSSAEHALADVDAQWGVFLRTSLPGGEDRGQLALWENRNLKIAARIQAVCSAYPGRNVLVIYGAAHKPFLESYLGRMMNTEIVCFDDLTSP